MIKKAFSVPRRDGTKAKFVFVFDDDVSQVCPYDKIWFWDLPDGKSLPLPDVDLGDCKKLPQILDKIREKRGDAWVGQVVTDLLK